MGLETFLILLVLAMVAVPVGLFIKNQRAGTLAGQPAKSVTLGLDELDDLPGDTEINVIVQPTLIASAEIKHSPYPVGVIGESKYRDELDEICGHPEKKINIVKDAVLIPADTNPHERFDEHPVRVTVDGKTVGYLNSDDAADYNERFGSIELKCQANIHGGGWVRSGKYRGNYGVEVSYNR